MYKRQPVVPLVSPPSPPDELSGACEDVCEFPPLEPESSPPDVDESEEVEDSEDVDDSEDTDDSEGSTGSGVGVTVGCVLSSTDDSWLEPEDTLGSSAVFSPYTTIRLLPAKNSDIQATAKKRRIRFVFMVWRSPLLQSIR